LYTDLQGHLLVITYAILFQYQSAFLCIDYLYSDFKKHLITWFPGTIVIPNEREGADSGISDDAVSKVHDCK
jgi:hypothetical protein